MKRTFFLLVAAMVLTSCSSYGVIQKKSFKSEVCALTVRGSTDEKFEYGDSFLRAKSKSDVGSKTEFRIDLKPKSRTHWPTDVTTLCTSGKGPEPDLDPIPCTWLNKTQSFDDSRYLVFCVPEGLEVGSTFKYDISVPTIGTLDPRIEVTW